MFDIDLYDPDFIIDCAAIKTPKKIYTLMRKNFRVTRAYVYAIAYKTKLLAAYDFIKVGRSCPNLGENRDHQVGERLVRQLAWVPGWECDQVKSSHGYDFWHNIETFAIPSGILPQNFNKNRITIALWDVTKRMAQSDFISDDEELTASCWAEGHLANQYKLGHDNKLPPLNYVDPSNNKIFNQPRISKAVYSSIFQEFDMNADV